MCVGVRPDWEFLAALVVVVVGVVEVLLGCPCVWG